MSEPFRPTAADIPRQQLPYPASQADMVPPPATELASYRPAGKLAGRRRPHHRRRLGHRARRRGGVRAGGRRRGRAVQRARRRRRGDAAAGRVARAAVPAPQARRARVRPVPRRRGPHRRRAGRARRARQQRRLPEGAAALRGHHRGAVGPHVPHEHLRLLLHGPGGAPAPARGRLDHQHRQHRRPHGARDPDRLHGQQGGHPRVHQVARAPSRRAQDPRQLRGARPGVDAQHPGHDAATRRSRTSATRSRSGAPASPRSWRRRTSSSRRTTRAS